MILMLNILVPRCHYSVLLNDRRELGIQFACDGFHLHDLIRIEQEVEGPTGFGQLTGDPSLAFLGKFVEFLPLGQRDHRG